jgi:hypothetical protein
VVALERIEHGGSSGRVRTDEEPTIREADMTNEHESTEAKLDEVPHEEWARWCATMTSDHSGRSVVLRQADRAIGEVQLAEGQKLVAVEFAEFGKTEALTIKCGSTAVPVSYVVAQPRSIGERRDKDGVIDQVTIIDTTGRRTSVYLA